MCVLKGFRVSVWCGYVSYALLVPVSANASTVTVFDPGVRRGGPIAQSFLENQADNVSLVRTQNGISCVASRVLPIADASYSTSDGTPVSFDDVTRSPASSIQAVAHRGKPIAFRIQLKYSPDPSRPVKMQIGGQTLDLAGALEPSGDSVLLTGDAAELLADELRLGSSPILHATSDATGRQIADRIMAPDMAGLDSCLVMLEDLPADVDLPDVEISNHDVADTDLLDMEWRDADDRMAETPNGTVPGGVSTIAENETGPYRPVAPIPVTGLRLEFTARPDPELRVDPSALKHCRMRDIPDDVFLGRLKAVTGFFSQTQDIYVAFDDRGELQRAYIPGIFDSDLTMGTNTARISLAADSNLPDEPNTVRGCLGDAPLEAPVCTISKSGDDDYTVAECGVLGMSQTRQDYPDGFFVPFFPGINEMVPAKVTTRDSGSNGTFTSRSIGTGPSFRGSGGVGGGGGGGGSPPGGGGGFFSNDPTGNSPDPGDGDNDVPAVPLPAALWMMLLAVTGLFGTSALRQRRKYP